MLLYAITTFLSAFLLFQIEPMITKIILPWFGGSAAVWTTALMFFQLVLLLGYLYAWATNQFLKPKAQVALHVVLLAISLAFLPVIPSARFKPAGAAEPTFGILLLLTATIGLPYLLLSTTGPLMQAWYVRANASSVPYRLYALSNLGSMLALLTYPVAVEPFLPGHDQAWLWSGGYALFCVSVALVAWKGSKGEGVVTSQDPLAEVPAPPNLRVKLLWVAMTACASVLLLAVTSYLTQNITPMPFLWVLPLSLYLLSFILCFEYEWAYKPRVYLPLLLVGLGGMAASMHFQAGEATVRYAVPGFSIAFFVCCMICHGEVARRKPHPRYLTLFYLLISIGGALGGLFVALLAPKVFPDYYEFPIGLMACAVLATIALWREPTLIFRFFPKFALRSLMLLFVCGLAGFLIWDAKDTADTYRLQVRNFYGALKVRDQKEDEDNNAMRMLVHGTISHGEQLRDPQFRRTHTSYYSENSGIGLAMLEAENRPSIHAAVIGLGAGVLATYCRDKDSFDFYDINPAVYKIATTEFTFLGDCPGQKHVFLGDARLIMESRPPQQYDVIAVDAFSGDAIPVHLLTREAFQLYFKHLKPTGTLGVHISNQYLDLAPVVSRIAQDLGKHAIVVDDEEDKDYLSSSTWIIFPGTDTVFASPGKSTTIEPLKPAPKMREWTDDYSNLVQILK